MSVIRCKQCGSYFQEDDSNAAIHYSIPSDICRYCKNWNELEKG